MTSKNDWDTYERLVIGKLDDHTASLRAIHDEVIRLQIEMGVVKTKLGFIGLMSGMVGSTIITLINKFLIANG